MSTERERLAKMLRNAYDRIGPDAVPTVDRIAVDLLAAGVTLPPEPPALVTAEMAGEWLCRTGDDSYAGNLRMLNDLEASAIRRAVERKTDGDHVRLDADGKHCAYIQHVSTRSLLALFGLDGGVP